MELLIVIAVIGIITSVGVISLNSARDKAKEANALSQMKNMQTMAMLCLDENSDIQCSDATGCDGEFAPGANSWLCLSHLGSWRWPTFEDYTYQKSDSKPSFGHFCFEIKKNGENEYISCFDTGCVESNGLLCGCTPDGGVCASSLDCCGNLICGGSNKCG